MLLRYRSSTYWTIRRAEAAAAADPNPDPDPEAEAEEDDAGSGSGAFTVPGYGYDILHLKCVMVPSRPVRSRPLSHVLRPRSHVLHGDVLGDSETPPL